MPDTGSTFKAEIHVNGSVRTVYAKKKTAGTGERPGTSRDRHLMSLGLKKANYAEFLVPAGPDAVAGAECCTICRTDLDASALELGCGHAFHKKCIKIWIWDNVTCPNCRKEIGGAS